MKDKQNSLIILKSTLSRLPSYYCIIEERQALGEEYISATAIAESLSINPVQVRKDIASICSEPGRPKLGFKIDTLLNDLKMYLGYDHYDEAVLVGVGALGHVLMQYGGFANYGLGIVAGFDKTVRDKFIADKPVLPVSKLVSFLRRTHIKIGIIAVPANEAQNAADLLAAGGVKAVWNFAPTTINLPDNILVKNENLAASLAALTAELLRRS
ncbi:MAG: redox-sensing transcriptional repressor Rex [Bacteroidales bacterium]|nr:redox-sensing transcriptional repressor Rex [Bacteroidales bacterium]